MSEDPYKEELKTAIALAREAGAKALEIAGGDFAVRDKGGQEGPVTEADEAANAIIVEGIARAFPEDLVIAEESPPPEAGANADRVWFVDPIDGTKEYVRRSGEWSVMIGLATAEEAVLGVVYQATRGRMMWAVRGEGAWLQEDANEPRPMKIKETQSLEAATAVRSRSHPSKRAERYYGGMGIKDSYRHGSVGLKLCEIADGRAQLYCNFSRLCKRWDTCAGDIILHEAGGVLSDWEGRPISYEASAAPVDRPFLGCTKGLQERLITYTREFRKKLEAEKQSS